MVSLRWMLTPCTRRRERKNNRNQARERDARSTQMIVDLQGRKVAAEQYLIPRQRRNHWGDAIAEMIEAGRRP